MLAPALQVDAILSQRGRHNEHEAQREIKNEFMALWDGIKAMGSAAEDRILVLPDPWSRPLQQRAAWTSRSAHGCTPCLPAQSQGAPHAEDAWLM